MPLSKNTFPLRFRNTGGEVILDKPPGGMNEAEVFFYLTPQTLTLLPKLSKQRKSNKAIASAQAKKHSVLNIFLEALKIP
jgi:hypothetical protein